MRAVAAAINMQVENQQRPFTQPGSHTAAEKIGAFHH